MIDKRPEQLARRIKGVYHKWSNKLMGRKSKRDKRRKRKEAIKQANVMSSKVESNQTKIGLVDTINKQYLPRSSNYRYDTSRYSKVAYFASCSHEPTLIASLDGIFCYAATKSTLNSQSLEKLDLVINCSNMRINSDPDDNFKLIQCSEKFKSLRALLNPVKPIVEELFLDWTDGSDWPAGIEFWRKLFDICKAEGYTDIVFTCYGGHGRTGTSLLSFLIANSPYVENMDKLYKKRLHKVYCDQAVETYKQEQYLAALALENRDKLERSNAVTWAMPEVISRLNTMDLTQDDGRCLKCKHFADLCDCNVGDLSAADQFALIPLNEFTPDSEGQQEANKAIVDELKGNYQWK